jgi:hypothetical protein
MQSIQIKGKFDPYDMTSEPVPIIAHENEVIIPVSTAKKMYPYLKRGTNLPYPILMELRNLFFSTNALIRK